jgi:hypothetical protein
MDSKSIFWIYLYIVFFSLVSFVILKCYAGVTAFDKYLYTDENEPTDYMTYIFSHVITYLIFGLVFGLDIYKEMIFKTILVESVLLSVHNCDIRKITNIDSGIKSIIIGIISYFIGAIMNSLIFYNYENK